MKDEDSTRIRDGFRAYVQIETFGFRQVTTVGAASRWSSVKKVRILVHRL